MDWKKRGRKLLWGVDEEATKAELLADDFTTPGAGPARGRVVFVDENGRPRHLPADLGELSREQRDAAIAALSQQLGGAPPDMARTAAIERLTELRAAGKITEEHFIRERNRLMNY